MSTLIMALSGTSEIGCKKILQCGHPCAGFENEISCPPCLKGCNYSLKQRYSDHCTICYTEELSKAPVIMLHCRHIFHLHCLKIVLQKRWVGPSITFGFMDCPICKAPVQHENLDPILQPIQDLKADVQRKALTRLTFDGLHTCDAIAKPSGRYYKDPEGYAMDRYSYYQCFTCKKAYFGGTAECLSQADFVDKHDPKELICGGCSSTDIKQVCGQHGTDHMGYKCRYCCSVAVYYCFGTTHFCTKCHDRAGDMGRMDKSRLPKCPAGPAGVQLTGECPLKIRHPPTGEEYALGCAICSNNETF